MKTHLFNQSTKRMPRKHLESWVQKIVKELSRRKILDKKTIKEMTIVFQDKKQAQSLNKSYRNKNYPTDVLSFSPVEECSLGELVICPQVVDEQARDNKWKFRDELSYMVLHGMLHLLGYDHEQNKKQADEMFKLQDEIFFKFNK